MKLYLVLHLYSDGDQAAIFSDIKKARAFFKSILEDYKKEGFNISVNAKNDSELREACDGSSLTITPLTLNKVG